MIELKCHCGFGFVFDGYPFGAKVECSLCKNKYKVEYDYAGDDYNLTFWLEKVGCMTEDEEKELLIKQGLLFTLKGLIDKMDSKKFLNICHEIYKIIEKEGV